MIGMTLALGRLMWRLTLAANYVVAPKQIHEAATTQQFDSPVLERLGTLPGSARTARCDLSTTTIEVIGQSAQPRGSL